MIGKIVNFIKYNNLFTIGLMCIVLGSGVTLAASEDVQKSIISSEETVQSIDNSYIIDTDVKKYNFALTIKNITEDADNYYVVYSYKNIAIEDAVWKDVVIEKNFTVNKKSLGGRDLGVFVSEQLGQMIDAQRTYLANVQKIEIAKGQTKKVVSVAYSGLIGKMLGSSDKVFDGYNPVIEEVKIKKQLAAVYNGPEGERTKSIPLSMQEEIKKEVEEILNPNPEENADATDDTPTENTTENTDNNTDANNDTNNNQNQTNNNIATTTTTTTITTTTTTTATSTTEVATTTTSVATTTTSSIATTTTDVATSTTPVATSTTQTVSPTETSTTTTPVATSTPPTTTTQDTATTTTPATPSQTTPPPAETTTTNPTETPPPAATVTQETPAPTPTEPTPPTTQ